MRPWREFNGRSIADIPYSEWVDLDFSVWRMQSILEQRAALLRLLEGGWCQEPHCMTEVCSGSSEFPIERWVRKQILRMDLQLGPMGES